MEAPVSESPKAVEYKILDKPRAREYFKEMAEKMVINTEGSDVIFFLDLSARPISYLYRRVFQIMYPDKKRPEIRYLILDMKKVLYLKHPQNL